MGKCKWSRFCEQPLVGKTYCDQHRLQHLARTKEWQARNKEKVVAYHKRYYEANRDVQREQHLIYYQANKDRLNAYTAEWKLRQRIEDPVAYAARRKREYAKWERHVAKDPIRHRLVKTVQRANKRAVRMGREGVLTYEEIRAVYDEQKGLCFDCGAADDPPKRTLHLGHGVPLFYKAGRNVKDNIMFQCISCNSKQHLNVHPKFGEGY